ncbi:hypothetical protein MMC09_004612 [Bachmanniomyces sp. S44760]|nr:hypothetical protein [Bachmanniomyces sp. S44760]
MRRYASGDDYKQSSDPRLKDLGRQIEHEYATFRDGYHTPKHPVILAHGLLGFDELHLAGDLLPGVHYWRGITEALTSHGTEVFTTSVPPSASIEQRATELSNEIYKKARGRSVNVIA